MGTEMFALTDVHEKRIEEIVRENAHIPDEMMHIKLASKLAFAGVDEMRDGDIRAERTDEQAVVYETDDDGEWQAANCFPYEVMRLLGHGHTINRAIEYFEATDELEDATWSNEETMCSVLWHLLSRFEDHETTYVVAKEDVAAALEEQGIEAEIKRPKA